ncbi:hypothetical protein VNI00_017179 [Paramarasmius palmivorus]|uniref:Rho-GAP domain-containing protein n=1 Tax=Paramarasmius palmivorus TaxID=297713 RepID=A0AAW0BAJ5_9AGAR
MAEYESALRLLLRDSDRIISILEVFAIPESPTSADENDEDFENILQDLRNKRILAVVTHQEGANGLEEGSVFVLKQKHSANGYLDELDIRHIFPIYGDFSISMAQVKRITQGIQSPTRSHLSAQSVSLDTSAPGLKLTVKAGLESNEVLHLFTYDVQGLRTILAECRRLKEVSGSYVSELGSHRYLINARSEQSASGALPETFSWLATYTSRSINLPTCDYRRIRPKALSKIPPDLRTESIPLQDRLSSASAGIPGDDADDILMIRESWVRKRARETCRKARARLNIRVGTFNVNGKMPSQDLAAWVRGDNDTGQRGTYASDKPTLPPMKDISPLSMGEVVKNPIEQVVNDTSSVSASIETSNSTLRADTSDGPPTFAVDPEHSEDPDIFVFGFQELDLSTEALLYSTSTLREDAWCMAIFAALGEKRDLYEKLGSKQLVGMLIVILVKKSLKSCFSNVMTCATGVGIMGVMGNKGGTAIRVSFTPPAFNALQTEGSLKLDPSSKIQNDITSPGSTTLTFVCSHLAAFDEMVDKRNADFQDLSRRLMFVESINSTSETIIDEKGNASVDTQPSAAVAAPQPVLERYNVYESDALFWAVRISLALSARPASKSDVVVDLNYRIDLPDYDVRSMLAAEHWKEKYERLLQYDQLKNAMRNQKAFHLFMEHPISHLPTYRFSSGVLTDDLGYDIKRKPAWTDRILYAHSGHTTHVQQISYAGHPEITMSDHRPASADFVVEVDAYDKSELQATAKHLFRQLHGMEERQERSKAKVHPSTVDFGQISYRKKVDRSVTFQNNGKIPCAFRFVPVETGNSIHPDWLSVSPMTVRSPLTLPAWDLNMLQGLLLPNEAIEIVLSAFVDDNSAAQLNLEPPNLDCTLILHTLMGKDHFISVTAQYQYTCFANKLSRLTRLPGPIRSLKGPQDLLDENRAINAPREIMRLVNWMMTGNHSVENMFMKDADQDIMHQIRECLDTGEDFPFSPEKKDDAVLVAFGESLLQLLGSLPDGIIPSELHNQCAQVTNRDEAFEILDALSPESVNVWISVTAFLHFVVQSSALSEMKAQRIAARFAPVLLRDDLDSPSPVSPLQRHRFLLRFLE